MDCISLYNNASPISKVSENSQRKRLLPLSTTPMSFNAPAQGISKNICINQISSETSHWPTFLPLIVWVYLHSNVFVVGSERRISFCNRVRIGRSRTSKVVDFGTNRKGVCNFLLVIDSTVVLSCTVSDIRRSIGWKLQILDELFIAKTRVLGLSPNWWRFRDPSLRRFDSCQRMTDGQTDRRTTDRS